MAVRCSTDSSISQTYDAVCMEDSHVHLCRELMSDRVEFLIQLGSEFHHMCPLKIML